MAVHKRKRNPNARPIALRQGRRHEQRQRNEARFLEVGTGGRVRRIRAVALRRHGRPGRAGRWRRRDQQRLRPRPDHHQGSVLGRRASEPVRRPLGHERKGEPESSARPSPHASNRGASLVSRRLHAPAGGGGGHLALRCGRHLLGRAGQHRRAELPPRVPGHGRRGDRAVHHHLPRLLLGPDRPHPREGADLRRVEQCHH